MAEETIPEAETAAALYIGNLDAPVTEEELRRLFAEIGEVDSVKICMDQTTERSLGYGYVNYRNPDDAAKAAEGLNLTPLHGKRIRISYSARGASLRRSGLGNLFIKNLDKQIDEKDLLDIFSPFGNILSSRIGVDASGNSKGYGFVHFDSEESARAAIEQLNGALVHGKVLSVGPYLSKEEREMLFDKTKFTNVFVKNFTASTTEEDFTAAFREFGPITSAAIMRDENGNSKCYGFVNFEYESAAANSVEMLNGRVFNGKKWYVGRAQTKSERERELKLRHEQFNGTLFGANNLYVKHLDEEIDDDKLKEFFSPFGSVISCKVMCDSNGISKGSGFVAFSTEEEASKAMLEMNGKMVGRKPLYVAIAERKEDRIARLQARFSNVQPNLITPPVSPSLPIYSPGSPNLITSPVTPHPPIYPPGSPKVAQQMFYGHPPPAILPPMPVFRYPHQFVPDHLGPSRSHIPNGALLMMQQGSRGPHNCNIPYPDALQHIRPPFPLTQPQMFGRGNACHPPQPGYPSPNVSAPVTKSPYKSQPPAHTSKREILASGLANASPTERRTMLGEALYPLVEKFEEEMTAKVTGMLLEMDQTEVLQLLETPESLKAKVEEAMEVIRSAESQSAEQLASLVLHD